MRVDFNVPVQSGVVGDDTRIRAAIPTVNELAGAGARVVLCSHLGRPDGEVVEEMSLRPVAVRLSELIGQDIAFAEDCVGDAAHSVVAPLEPGQIALLENLRFHAEETDNDSHFAAQLATLADAYVNDAFGTAHRAHASTAGVTRHLSPSVAGRLMERELRYLGGILDQPEMPLVVLLGGAKISGKIDVLENLVERADAILIGGGMVFTFLAAMGKDVGNSLVEEDRLDTALRVIERAQETGCRLSLPSDFVIADAFSEHATVQTVTEDEGIPAGWMGLDIGPETIQTYALEISRAQTVVWNGPMGVFEMKPFATGTMEIAEAVALATDRGATTVVGGGDSVAAVNLAGIGDRITHVSTGGGASLELLEGKALPGIEALTDA